MTRSTLNRPRFRLEIVHLVGNEYGAREDWPPGLAFACELFCTVEAQLSRASFQKVLAVFRQPIWPRSKLNDVDEQLAFAVLADAAELLDSFSFGLLLTTVEELNEEDQRP
ncbi:hypothetical protein ACVWZD_000428 [Streptomyces sp. TE3672]